MKQQRSNELKYVQEHITCKHYAIEGPQLYVYRLTKGDFFKIDRIEDSTLIFVLEGKIGISTGIYINKVVEGGYMFFITKGDSIHGRVMNDTVLLSCKLKVPVSLCNEYSIKQLTQHIPQIPDDLSKDGFAILPIAEMLLAELKITRQAIESKLMCYHFLQIKREIFLLMLRAFYKKEELAYLFKPTLSVDFEFKDQVLRSYTSGHNAQELADLLGLPISTFNRKFKKAFGITSGQWLTLKRKENILKDLLMTDLSPKEIAVKYNLTPNYLINFCKEHFGNTPIELRERNM